MRKLGVTDHCVERFVERTSQKSTQAIPISDDRARRSRSKILEMVSKSTPVVLKPGYRANNVLHNGLRTSLFLRYSDWIFVLDKGMTTVITCYPSSALRWANKN